MADASLELFRSLSSYRRLQDLIDDGETEGLHLECKAPTTPRLTKDLRVHLGKAISGFANTAGGVVVWGLSTTKHSHSGLDVITQIEPLGNAARFEQQVARSVPTLATPPVLKTETKVVKRRSSDTRGVVLLAIPQTEGDPVQSTEDNLFYFRSGDEFSIAPYDMIKRLFSATASPDLRPVFVGDLVEEDDDGFFRIPIVVTNRSSAIAEHVKVSVVIENADACRSIDAGGFSDISGVNPGSKIYMSQYDGIVHRGLNQVLGHLRIKMQSGRRRKRRLDMTFTLYADKMRARYVTYAATLVSTGFRVRQLREDYLY